MEKGSGNFMQGSGASFIFVGGAMSQGLHIIEMLFFTQVAVG
jgi:hypothetical protein